MPNRGNVSRISGFRNLSNQDAYQVDLASAAASLERRLAYVSPPIWRTNRVSSLGKVDDKTVASSTDSVFERLYRREKRKVPVNVDESTVRTLRTKRHRAKALATIRFTSLAHATPQWNGGVIGLCV